MSDSDTPNRFAELLRQLGVAAIYVLLARIALAFFSDNGMVSIVWPSSGLALAALLIGGKRYLWSVFFGALLSSAMSGNALVASVAIAAGNTLEAFICVWLLTRNGSFDAALQTLRSYLLLIMAGSIGSIGSAFGGATAMLLAGFLTPEAYLINMSHWWMGDVLGIALIAPLILVGWQAKNDWCGAKCLTESSLLIALTFLAGQIVFLGWFHDGFGHMARGYVMFLFITWIAARLGTLGTVIALTMIAIQALLGAYLRVGFFANSIAQDQLVNCWLYIMILSVVGIALATLISAQKRAKEELHRFFDLVPDMVCIASTEGRFLKVNRAWQTTLGYTEQEILDTPFLDFIHPDDREPTMKEVERQIAGEATIRFCNRYRGKGGSYKWLEWRAAPAVGKTQLFASARDVTERKQVEAERRLATREIEQAQKMLQTVLDTTPDWIFAKDRDYRFLFVNRAFAAAQGCTPEDMVGRPDTDFWSAELCLGDPARGVRGFHDDDDAAMAGKMIHNPNDVATFEGGNLHIFDTLKLPLFDAAGSCFGMLGYSRDVTERKMIEKELLDSKRQLQSTLDAIPDLLFEVGLDGRYHNFHASRPELLATPADAFLGKTVRDVLPPEAADMIMVALHEANEKGSSFGRQIELSLPQGTSWFELSIAQKGSSAGEEHRFIVLSRDITKRKATEQALLESEGMLRQAQNIAHVGHYKYNPINGVVDGSDELFRIFGLSKGQFQLSDFIKLVYTDDYSFVESTIESVIEQQSCCEFECRLLLRDGTLKWVKTIGRFVLAQDKEQSLLIGTVQDITERKATEQQLHELAENILNVREEEKISIAREIHDELGGTLNALKLDAFWLSRKLPAYDEAKVFLDRIESMSQRIDNAINFTRRIIDDLRPSILDDLGLLAAIEWQAAEFSVRTGIDCRVRCIEDEANLDERRSIALFRILQEALTNVSRHSGASRVEIEFAHKENEVMLTVSDNGCGITNKLTAASRSYGMLGMKERAMQLGGRIIFSSPQGGGFNVEITLPLPSCEKEG